MTNPDRPAVQDFTIYIPYPLKMALAVGDPHEDRQAVSNPDSTSVYIDGLLAERGVKRVPNSISREDDDQMLFHVRVVGNPKEFASALFAKNGYIFFKTVGDIQYTLSISVGRDDHGMDTYTIELRARSIKSPQKTHWRWSREMYDAQTWSFQRTLARAMLFRPAEDLDEDRWREDLLFTTVVDEVKSKTSERLGGLFVGADGNKLWLSMVLLDEYTGWLGLKPEIRFELENL